MLWSSEQRRQLKVTTDDRRNSPVHHPVRADRASRDPPEGPDGREAGEPRSHQTSDSNKLKVYLKAWRSHRARRSRRALNTGEVTGQGRANQSRDGAR